MLREIEASCALQKHLTVDAEAQTVTWQPPLSKTDPAVGCKRTWACICGGQAIPCPHCETLAHLEILNQLGLRNEQSPVLTTVHGEVAHKAAVV
eukprot:1150291-Amphidinium_carterae.1